MAEFLDALSYSLSLPDGHIVGFQDRNGKSATHDICLGLIITPSFVCHNSQDLRSETYDVLIKNTPSLHGNLSGLLGVDQSNSMAQHTSLLSSGFNGRNPTLPTFQGH